jgi:hypothetical protein
MKYRIREYYLEFVLSCIFLSIICNGSWNNIFKNICIFKKFSFVLFTICFFSMLLFLILDIRAEEKKNTITNFIWTAILAVSIIFFVYDYSHGTAFFSMLINRKEYIDEFYNIV